MLNNNVAPIMKASFDYQPVELKVADYSLSVDLVACETANKLPLIKPAVEKLIKHWNKPMEQLFSIRSSRLLLRFTMSSELPRLLY
jgi:carbamate kinase